MPSSKPIACISTIRRRLSTLLAAALAACDGPSDDREQFREQCEQQFACDCITHRFADIDACMQAAEANRAGLLAQFAAAGLTPDIACMDQLQAFDPEWCSTWQEYDATHPLESEPESTQCGVCSLASGDRQVGEPCITFGGSASDCASGLYCHWSLATGFMCIDPCVPASAGLPCDSGINTCAEGLDCSRDSVCVPSAEPGEDCTGRGCVDHYTCDRDQQRCIPLADEGESCLDVYCDAGLICPADHVCRPPPKLGEPCDDWCPGEMACHPIDKVCGPLLQIGDPCEQERQCAPELYCKEMTCTPGGGPGDPCEDSSDPCRIDLSCIHGECGPGQGLICG